MLVKFSTIVSTAVLLLASRAVAAPAAGQEVTARNGDVSARGEELGSLIATDPYFACNCPNNCKHKKGSSCKYYSNFSTSGPVATGTCDYKNNQLYCYA